MSEFDLQAYLHRIGRPQSAPPDASTLRALHRAHVEHIPFENLEIQMGGSIVLEPAALQHKMVLHRRGGYCFEQNTLFLLALRATGFAAEPREARVRQGGAGNIRPRTHMVLSVPCDGREWLADVGFGGDGLIEPIVVDGEEAMQLETRYRVVPDAGGRVLQRFANGAWEDLYIVEPQPVHPVDFEVGNWFTSTSPRSRFVTTLTAQRIVGGARHILRDLTYSVTIGSEIEIRQISRDEVVPLLRGTFNLDVPRDARFRALDAPPRTGGKEG
jgi:N-hydroxyarylamine O-acetyltransferase